MFRKSIYLMIHVMVPWSIDGWMLGYIGCSVGMVRVWWKCSLANPSTVVSGKSHNFPIDFEKIADEQAEHLKSLAYLLLSALRCLALKQVQGTWLILRCQRKLRGRWHDQGLCGRRFHCKFDPHNLFESDENTFFQKNNVLPGDSLWPFGDGYSK